MRGAGGGGGKGEATPLPRGRKRFPPLCKKSKPEEILCIRLDSSNWMASRDKKVQRLKLVGGHPYNQQ